MPPGCPHRTAAVIAREAALTSLPAAAAPLRVAHCLVGLADGGKGAHTDSKRGHGLTDQRMYEPTREWAETLARSHRIASDFFLRVDLRNSSAAFHPRRSPKGRADRDVRMSDAGFRRRRDGKQHAARGAAHS